jgi:hypothetical protein
LPSADLGNIRLGRFFDGVDQVCFEGLPFLNEFFDALRVCFRRFAKSLIGTGLASGSGAWTLGFVLSIHIRYGEHIVYHSERLLPGELVAAYLDDVGDC